MKQFACGSVVSGCAAVLEAETEDELVREAQAHGGDAHGMDEVAPEVVEQVRANICDV